MPNALAIWAIRARHLLSHVFEYWLWWYRYFEVKLAFEMLTVRGQQHSFSTHERMFLWKCQSFWDRKCLDRKGTRTPYLLIHAECSNHSSYQGHNQSVEICNLNNEFLQYLKIHLFKKSMWKILKEMQLVKPPPLFRLHMRVDLSPTPEFVFHSTILCHYS